ncbi:multiple cyclophane-containing RiPP AmcA [Streptomyces sp. NPDC008125]|uniref:multiple cyclophane-containing RiPP AmcA n=1 Tax=Streptomyces sp. NPDC008125 TaxID=3364811 RepID=UPI0036E3455B
MSVNTVPDATAVVMNSAPGFASLLEAAGATAIPFGERATSDAEQSSPLAARTAPALAAAATFDNRPTWDNPTQVFDNRPTWDNWKKK